MCRAGIFLATVLTLVGCNQDSSNGSDSDTDVSPNPILINDVEIEDEAFRTCVVDFASSKGWTLSAQVTEISCLQQGIRSISGVESFVNLRVLFLQNRVGYHSEDDIRPLNAVTDLSPLAELSNLERLYIDGNAVTSVEALASHSQLITLAIRDNRITSLLPLENLTSLEYLNAEGNRIQALPSFSGSESLKYVYLRSNDIEDASGLANLPNLETLDLSSNQITSTLELTGLEKLKTLMLSDNEITALDLVDSEESLTSITVSDNKFEHLESLLVFSNLETLSIDDNLLSSLASLEQLTQLDDLDISENPIQDISALSSLTKLTSLNISDTKLGDVEPLDIDLAPLSSLTELTSLKMNNLGNQTTDQALSSLATLTKMQYLEIAGVNTPFDLSPLSGMKSLVGLTYTFQGDENYELDISALSGIATLTFLELYGFKLHENSSRIFEEYKDQLLLLAITYFEEQWLKDVLVTMDKLNFLDLTYAMHAAGYYSGLDFLSDMDQVGFLTLSSNPLGFSNSRVADSTGLEGMANLKSLDIQFIGLDSSKPLEQMTNLFHLSIINGKDDFIDSEVLSSLKGLTSLKIVDTPVSDTDFLTELTELNVLAMNYVNIFSLENFSGLSRLISLDIGKSSVNSLAPIEGLTQLKYINAQGSGVNCEDVASMAMASPATLIESSGDCDH